MFASCVEEGAGYTLGDPGNTALLPEAFCDEPGDVEADDPPAPVPPTTLYLMVVHGARMMSSWSMPNVFAPFGVSTPTTRKPTFWIRSSRPTGEAPWNNSRTIVRPTMQTRA